MTRYFILLGLILTAAVGCEEIPPAINFDPIFISADDTTYVEDNVPSADQRVALLEEFTGVRCVNCVAGHIKIDELIDKYGPKLAAVSIHSTFFARPIPGESKIDFRTAEADELAVFLGVGSLPNGVVDRTIFPAETVFPVPISKWDSYINQHATVAPRVNLELALKDYNEADSTFTIQCTITCLDDITGSLNLSAMIIESGLIDLQWGPVTSGNPSGELPNYEHNHVMREMITAPSGSLLNVPDYQRGRVIIRNYPVKLSKGEVPENSEIIAFVHFVGTEKTVLQAAQEHVK